MSMTSDRYPIHKRPCPICGAEGATVLYRQRFQSISDAGILDGYDVVACRRCGFGYADQIPDQAAFDAYYRDLSKYEYHDRNGNESSYDKISFRQVADLIEGQIPSRQARILDIG